MRPVLSPPPVAIGYDLHEYRISDRVEERGGARFGVVVGILSSGSVRVLLDGCRDVVVGPPRRFRRLPPL